MLPVGHPFGVHSCVTGSASYANENSLITPLEYTLLPRRSEAMPSHNAHLSSTNMPWYETVEWRPTTKWIYAATCIDLNQFSWASFCNQFRSAKLCSIPFFDLLANHFCLGFSSNNFRNEFYQIRRCACTLYIARVWRINLGPYVKNKMHKIEWYRRRWGDKLVVTNGRISHACATNTPCVGWNWK